MDCILVPNKFKHVILSCILVTFSLATVMPQPAYCLVDTINLGIKIQKLVDRAIKYYEKSDSENLLDAVLEIKSEIEAIIGRNIDLDSQIDLIENEFKKKVGKLPKKEFKQFRKLIKGKDKKNHKRTVLIESYLSDELNISIEDYEDLYMVDDARKHKPKEKESEEVELPLKFVLGVTLILGGAFVMFASSVCPPLIFAGESLIGTGFSLLVDAGLDIYQKE